MRSSATKVTVVPGSSVMRKTSASGLSSRSGRMPWLAVIAAMRGRAEIGPDDARADQPEMRRDEEAVDLLVGVVGEREDDPVRPRAGLARLDGDAAHDAVAARRGRDLDDVAVGAVALDASVRSIAGASTARAPLRPRRPARRHRRGRAQGRRRRGRTGEDGREATSALGSGASRHAASSVTRIGGSWRGQGRLRRCRPCIAAAVTACRRQPVARAGPHRADDPASAVDAEIGPRHRPRGRNPTFSSSRREAALMRQAGRLDAVQRKLGEGEAQRAAHGRGHMALAGMALRPSSSRACRPARRRGARGRASGRRAASPIARRR